MVLYELLCNVRIYIVFPTIEGYIVIPSAEDCTVILATGDCLMIPLFASSTCLMFYLYILFKDLLYVALRFAL